MIKRTQRSSTDGDEAHPLSGGLTKTLGRRSFLKGALAAAPLLVVGPTLLLPRKAAAAKNFGPSTTTEAYMVPHIRGVEVVAILTVGDSIAGYRLVGIPDGLGAFRSHGHAGEGKRKEWDSNAKETFTLLINHELGGTSGIVRAHGSRGAFVSQWTIDDEEDDDEGEDDVRKAELLRIVGSKNFGLGRNLDEFVIVDHCR